MVRSKGSNSVSFFGRSWFDLPSNKNYGTGYISNNVSFFGRSWFDPLDPTIIVVVLRSKTKEAQSWFDPFSNLSLRDSKGHNFSAPVKRKFFLLTARDTSFRHL